MEFTSQKLVVNSIWSLSETTANKIIFYKDAGNQFTVDLTGATAPYTATVAAADNEKAPGAYLWQAFLDGVFVDQGTITLLPNLETSTEPRGQWMRVYQNLMNAIEALSSKQAESVSLFDGTQVTYADISKLIARAENAKTNMEIEIGKRPAMNKKYLSRFPV